MVRQYMLGRQQCAGPAAGIASPPPGACWGRGDCGSSPSSAPWASQHGSPSAWVPLAVNLAHNKFAPPPLACAHPIQIPVHSVRAGVVAADQSIRRTKGPCRGCVVRLRRRGQAEARAVVRAGMQGAWQLQLRRRPLRVRTAPPDGRSRSRSRACMCSHRRPVTTSEIMDNMGCGCDDAAANGGTAVRIAPCSSSPPAARATRSGRPCTPAGCRRPASATARPWHTCRSDSPPHSS